MGRSKLPPDDWAKAAAGWSDEFFKIRVSQCDSVDRLRAGLKREDERPKPTRKDRIAALNNRMREIQE